MKLEIIQQMIRNSTWVNTNNSKIFKFENEKDLFLDEEKHLSYSLCMMNEKPVISLSSNTHYYIEYVNDFILNFYNDREFFSIEPE